MIAQINASDLSVDSFKEIIYEFGLIYDANPEIYGEENRYMNKTRDELGVYQTPSQFAFLLFLLSKKTLEINSYCEIGIFRGGTFLMIAALLTRLNPNVKLMAVETEINHIHPDALPYIYPYLVIGTSDDVKYKQFDVAFIDGDHTLSGIGKDYANIGKYAKICIFHDIVEPTCPDVGEFWNILKRGRLYYEFTASGCEYQTQGIGVIVQKNPFNVK